MAPGAAQAADAIFFEGLANTSGAWAPLPYVKLIQVDIRSLDGHSACTDALAAVGGSTSPVCTNGLASLSGGGLNGVALWRAHAFSGWSGNYVDLRARHYYN